MTREVAEEYVKDMTYRDAVHNALQGKCIPYRKATLIKLYELLDRLEQEPCEDAIGRSDMLDAIGHGTTYTSEDLQKIIKGLPSVTPQMMDQWQELKETIIEMRDNDGTGTQQEACKFLANLMDVLENQMSGSEIPNSSDCISRQAVLDKKELIELEDGQSFYCISPEDVETLPPVTPQQKTGRWIPVSERLPEDLEPVNITWVNHEPEPYYHDIKDRNFVATGIYYRGQWYWYSTTCADYLGEYGSNDIDKVDDAVEIVAWMPLPEPYKAESEG